MPAWIAAITKYIPGIGKFFVNKVSSKFTEEELNILADKIADKINERNSGEALHELIEKEADKDILEIKNQMYIFAALCKRYSHVDDCPLLEYCKQKQDNL